MRGISDTLIDRANSYRMGGPSSEHTAAMLEKAAYAIDELVNTLYEVLPYIEAQEGDQHYKPGAVAKVISKINAAIAKAEGR